MGLDKYNKKRDFSKTPEPEGKKGNKKDTLSFVIQKHDASSLHYDLRLEMEGVFKSWAVPKGPSLNPDDKRLAMKVEDHPLDYGDFEGVIPEGNYGAGKVIVWDNGYYYHTDGRKSDPKEDKLLEGLKKGDLKIILRGNKVKGEFALVEMHKKDEKSWLLIKKKDNHASKKDVTKKEKSAKSGKKIENISKEDGVHSGKGDDTDPSSAPG